MISLFGKPNPKLLQSKKAPEKMDLKGWSAETWRLNNFERNCTDTFYCVG